MSSATTTPHTADTGAEALFALLHIQAQIVRAIDEHLLGRHGTGLSGFELMTRLMHIHADGASLRLLAEQVVISPSRVSRLAAELAARGWLERATSPEDGRLAVVRLTPDGHAAFAEMESTFAEALQQHFTDRLTRRQLAELVSIGRALGAPHC